MEFDLGSLVLGVMTILTVTGLVILYNWEALFEKGKEKSASELLKRD